MIDVINDADLDLLRRVQSKSAYWRQQAQYCEAQARAIEEFASEVMTDRYGVTVNDTIDTDTGVITRGAHGRTTLEAAS